MQSAQATQRAVEAGAWDDATAYWGDTESAVMLWAENVDFYNILSPISYYIRSSPNGRHRRLKPGFRGDRRLGGGAETQGREQAYTTCSSH